MIRNVLILGGAGFIGSNLVKKFCESGMSVTVIDALYEKTGASMANIYNYLPKIHFIQNKVEEIENLTSIVENNELIIDAMGWTAHNDAIKDPEYDIKLNIISHLAVIKALRKQRGKSVIYLGSRGQYGNSIYAEIKEDYAMLPEDVQGINKLSGEFYYRVYSKFFDYNILSLRIPNCFGENQPKDNNDLGLIGSFIKDSLEDKIIEVYGNHRKRSILYVTDLTDIIMKLKDSISNGFTAININGTTILINDIAQKIIEICGSGSLVVKQIPPEVMKIDTGSSSLNEDRLRKIIPDLKFTNIELALSNTIKYFKKK